MIFAASPATGEGFRHRSAHDLPELGAAGECGNFSGHGLKLIISRF